MGLSTGFYRGIINISGGKPNGGFSSIVSIVCVKLLGYYEGSRLRVKANPLKVSGEWPSMFVAYYGSRWVSVAVFPAWSLLVLALATVASATFFVSLRWLRERNLLEAMEVFHVFAEGFDGRAEYVVLLGVLASTATPLLVMAGYPAAAIHAFTLSMVAVALALLLLSVRLRGGRGGGPEEFFLLSAAVILTVAVLAIAAATPVLRLILGAIVVVVAMAGATAVIIKGKGLLPSVTMALLAAIMLYTLIATGLLAAFSALLLAAAPFVVAVGPPIAGLLGFRLERVRELAYRLWIILLASNMSTVIGVTILYMKLLNKLVLSFILLLLFTVITAVRARLKGRQALAAFGAEAGLLTLALSAAAGALGPRVYAVSALLPLAIVLLVWRTGIPENSPLSLAGWAVALSELLLTSCMALLLIYATEATSTNYAVTAGTWTLLWLTTVPLAASSIYALQLTYRLQRRSPESTDPC